MPLSAHNDQNISLYKYIRWGLPLIAYSEAFHRLLTIINLDHLNKYNKQCSDSGIVPHQIYAQERYLLGIIALGSIDASNSTAKATATEKSGNWYRWCTFLKNSVIADKLLVVSHKSRGKSLCHHPRPQCDKTSLAQLGNKYSSTELKSPPYWMYLLSSGRTFGATQT